MGQGLKVQTLRKSAQILRSKGLVKNKADTYNNKIK